ncbi:MAG: alpha/beta hydrolase family protein [Candidatus Sulfotelmatobacter sp.]
MQSKKLNFSALRFYALIAVLLLTGSSLVAQQNAPAASKPDSDPATAPPQSTNQADTAAKPAPPTAVAPPYEIKPAIDPKTNVPLYETIQEDWSSLQIGISKLAAEPPLVGEVDDEPGFTRTLVQVKWRPGDPIDLWVVVPKGVKKPPVVLYLYNFTEDTGRFKDDGWCKRVTTGGVAAAGFVSALSGSRFHDRPMKQWFVSELQESLGSTVHDVKFILDYLDSRGDLDMNRVGMFGEGSGGAVALMAAVADPRIKAVDALDPWGDWPDFLNWSPVMRMDDNPDQFMKPEFLKKVAPLDPVKWLPELNVPVRVQQVKTNLSVPMQSKEKIAAAVPKQAELMRFETVDELSRREGKGGLFLWIKGQVQAAGTPATGSDAPKASLAEGKAASGSSTPPQR